MQTVKSTLKYAGIATPDRLQIIDETAGPDPGPAYHRAGTKKPLKYFPFSGLVAWLDYTVTADSVYIHYFIVRDDQRNKGLARQLLNRLYDQFPDVRRIQWGDIMHPAAKKLFLEMRDTRPVPTFGKL